jgi:hypothetical protein
MTVPGTDAGSNRALHPRTLRSSERCPGAARFKDGAKDSRAWAMPAPADRAVAPPSGDARELWVRADARQLCVVFELRGPVKAGTELHFGAHGPPTKSPGGGTIFHGYGFQTVLSQGEDSVLKFGRRGDGPNVLDGKIRIGPTTVVVTIPRRELDRPPTNMPGVSPPFPYRGFGVEARVIGPASRGGGTEADFIPTEGTGSVGIKNGKACRAPCGIGLLAIEGPRRGG